MRNDVSKTLVNLRLVKRRRLATPAIGLVLAILGVTAPHAQTVVQPAGQGGALGVPGGLAPPSQTSTTQNATTPASNDALYRPLTWKTDVIIFPPVSQTIEGDVFGFRKTLADLGIGFSGFNATIVESNVLHSEKNNGREQIYAGQQPTAQTSTVLAVTYDLRRYGIPDGQIAVVGYENSTSWSGIGPNTIKFAGLSYYQSLFNDQVEIKAGLINETYEFIGQFVAGNVTSTFGPLAALGAETGQSGSFQATWGANIKVRFLGDFYDKFGVARGTNPDGPQLENQLNPTGLNFTTRNTGGWFIDELGYKVRPTPTRNAYWFRVGASDTNSRYVDRDFLTGIRTGGNYQLYALGDAQVLRVSNNPAQAFRGLYIGGSVQYAPSNIDAFYNYYEARIYGLGIIPGRPFDLASLVGTDNQFSRQLIHLARQFRQQAHTSAQSVTAAYSYQIIPGLYANAAVGYTDNPSVITYTTKTGSALTLETGIALYF